MFLTTPSRTWPSSRLEISSERSSARVSSRTARLEITILPRLRSILRIWNGCGEPINEDASRTGRISTWLPGRNATAPARSTVKPPLTRPKIIPLTRSWFSKAFSRTVQASSRRALSRERITTPLRSSNRSTKTSTSSPILTLISPSAPRNSRIGTVPSDFKPTSTMAKSFSTETTLPVTTLPNRRASPAKDSSNRSAKFSVLVGRPVSSAASAMV